MALTVRQLREFEKVEGLPIKKIICVVKAAVKVYKCVKAADGDIEKIAACAKTFIGEIEKCLKKK